MSSLVVIGVDELRALLCEELSRIRQAPELNLQSAGSAEDLGTGCRKDLPKIAALLTLQSWEDVVRTAATLGVDLRPLNEREVAWLLDIKLRTVRAWRGKGVGPDYHNQAGALAYPLRWLFEWQERGRQTSTSQGTRRGRRTDL